MRKLLSFINSSKVCKVTVAILMAFIPMQNAHADLFGTDSAGISALLAQQVSQYKQDYEILLKNIEQLKQQTQQAKLLAEQAKQYTSGDLNGTVLNELVRASKELDSMLSDLSKAKDLINEKSIGFGSAKFSISDFAGLATGKRKWEDFKDAIMRAGEDELLKKCKEWSSKLSARECMYIWNTYGISPEDYQKIKLLGERAKDLTANVVAQTDSTLKSVMDKRQKYRETHNTFLNKLLSGEQVSQVEAAQADAAMNTMNGEILTDMLSVIQSTVARNVQLDAVKQSEKDAAEYSSQVNDAAWEADLSNTKVPDYWGGKTQMKGFSTTTKSDKENKRGNK